MRDNVIRVNFKSPERNAEPPIYGGTPIGNEGVDALQNALGQLGINLVPELRIRAHLSSLSGPRPSNKTIATHRNGLRNHNLVELRRIAEKSTPHEWSLHPGYFQALAEEIESKGGL